MALHAVQLNPKSSSQKPTAQQCRQLTNCMLVQAGEGLLCAFITKYQYSAAADRSFPVPVSGEPGCDNWVWDCSIPVRVILLPLPLSEGCMLYQQNKTQATLDCSYMAPAGKLCHGKLAACICNSFRIRIAIVPWGRQANRRKLPRIWYLIL